MQPGPTPFPIFNQLVFHDPFCCFLTCIQASKEAGKVVWHSHLLKNFPQFAVIHIVKGFRIVNEAEVDVFLEFSCFSYYPVEAGNLIPDSSTLDFPGSSDGKVFARNEGDLGSIPGSVRSPGEGNGNPLQYSEEPDRLQSTGSRRVGHNWETSLSLSSTLSKSSLNTWKFLGHILLKPGLENFEH